MDSYPSPMAADVVRESGRRRRPQGNTSRARKGAEHNHSTKQVLRCKTCMSCRLRKTKCDGSLPRCTSCATFDRECTYPQDARSASKQARSHVQTLEARIEFLQNTLRRNNIIEHEISNPPQISASIDNEHYLAEEQEGMQCEVYSSQHHIPTPAYTSTTSCSKLFSSSPDLSSNFLSTENPIPFSDEYCPSSPGSTVSEVTETAEVPTDKDVGPSSSEVCVAGAINKDGDIEVHGVSSMLHRQSLYKVDSSHSMSISEREKRNETSKSRLITNAVLQRQRESFIFGNPRSRVTTTIDFDGVDPELAMHLIELHFNRTHYSYLFTYRPAIIDGIINNGPYCNKILLNAIYVSSSLYSDRAELRANVADQKLAGERFYERLRALLVDQIDKPSIPTAVGLLLCGAALATSGRSSAGWIHCGIAYRMIIDLGCHLAVETRRSGLRNDMELLTDIEIEIRKRLYWGAFLTDSTQSLYFGRPPCLRASQARVPQLLLDTYEEMEAWSPYIDPVASPAAMAYRPHPAYAVSTFNANVRLFEISSRLIHAFYSIRSLKHSSRHIRAMKAAIASDLNRWRNSLPHHLCFSPENGDPTPPPHQMIPLTTYHTLQILLQRPFLANGHLRKHFNGEERHAGERISVSAALDICRLVKSYKATFTLRQAPYLISYSVYSAVVAILNQKSIERSQFTDYMSFFWSALTDLQRGANFGLQKPIEILREMTQQFGDGITKKANQSQSDTFRGTNDRMFSDIHRAVDTEGGGVESQQTWNLWSVADSAFSSSALDGMDWPDNDALYGLFNPDPLSI